MNSSEIEQKVIGIIAKKLDIDPAGIRGDTRLAEDLGIDSFGAVELMFELEEAFGLRIPDSEIEHVRTVADVAAYIDGWLAKNPPK